MKPCANCGNQHDKQGAFCGNNCAIVTEFIRLCRRWIREPDRQLDPGYNEVFTVKLALMTGIALGHEYRFMGGRHLDARSPTYQYVWKRDNGICVKCGAPGKEVHHINGGSNDPSNLEVRCHDCNMTDAHANIGPIAPEDVNAALEFQHELAMRIESPEPLHLCDDEQNWSKVWRKWPKLTTTTYRVLPATASFSDIKQRAQDGNLMPKRARLLATDRPAIHRITTPEQYAAMEIGDRVTYISSRGGSNSGIIYGKVNINPGSECGFKYSYITDADEKRSLWPIHAIHATEHSDKQSAMLTNRDV